MSNDRMIIDQAVPNKDAEIVTNPGQSLGLMLPERQDWFTIAGRLIKHTEGTIAGKKGTRGTDKSWDKGTLTLEEALFCVQYAISRGLNPFGDIHIWYYKQIQVCEHYRIMSGWANLRDPFTPKYFPLETDEERERHDLQPGDIGAICFVLKRADAQRWQAVYQAILTAMTTAGKLDLDLAERKAYEATAVSAVGIVKKDEMTKDGKKKDIDVRGWSWMQRAETRALRNALGRSHGTPTPAEIKAYAHKLNPGMTPAALTSPDFNPELPHEAQQKYFMLHDVQVANGQTISREERQRNVTIMRGEPENGIGEDGSDFIFDGFVDKVLDKIKYFKDGPHIRRVMAELELTYDLDDEPGIFDALKTYANKAADSEAQGEVRI